MGVESEVGKEARGGAGKLTRMRSIAADVPGDVGCSERGTGVYKMFGKVTCT